MKRTLLTFLLLVYAVTLLSGQVNVLDIESKQAIGKQLYFYKDVADTLTIENVELWSKQEQLAERGSKGISFLGFNTHNYWIKFELEGFQEAKQGYILQIAQPFNKNLDLYYKDAGGNWIVKSLGTSTPRSDLDIKSIYPTFELDNLSPQHSTVYVRVQNNSIDLPFYVYTKAHLADTKVFRDVIFGIFVGLLIFVIINNTYLYFFFRERTYLYYVCVVTGYLLFGVGYEGYFKPLVADGFWYYNYEELVSMLSHVAYGMVPAYTARFFELPKKHRLSRLVKIFVVTAILIFLGTLSSALAGNPVPFLYIIIANQTLALVALIITVFITLDARKQQLSGSTYFLVAYFCYFVFTLLEVL
ncbi:MAG: 7TM-DISM domain-containing protein, partial [Bacteroidota bacterium]